MRIIVLVMALTVTGCGTYGEPLILSSFYDRQDPCQLKNNQGRYPRFCGATSGRETIYTQRGEPIGYVQKSR